MYFKQAMMLVSYSIIKKDKEGIADHGNIEVEANVDVLLSKREESKKRHKAEHTSGEKKKRKKENNLSFDVPVKDQLIGQNPESGKDFQGADVSGDAAAARNSTVVVSGQSGFCKVDVEGENLHNNVCGVYGDRVELICCDSCPSTFHMECVVLEVALLRLKVRCWTTPRTDVIMDITLELWMIFWMTMWLCRGTFLTWRSIARCEVGNARVNAVVCLA